MRTIQLTDETFETSVLKADKPVLVDFGAEWCPPCRAMEPVLTALAQEANGKAYIGKLDVDKNPITSGKYGIRNLPTLIVFKSGEPVLKMVGVAPKHVISQKLKALL